MPFYAEDRDCAGSETPSPSARRSSGEGGEDWPWNELELMLEHMFQAPRTRFRPLWRPVIDLVEEEDEYVLMVDLPGVNPDDVDVSIRGCTLTIRGYRARIESAGPCQALIVERHHGPFERRIPLPRAADCEHVEASYKEGVLFIRIVKSSGRE